MVSGIKKTLSNKEGTTSINEENEEGFAKEQIKIPFISLVVTIVYIALINCAWLFCINHIIYDSIAAFEGKGNKRVFIYCFRNQFISIYSFC